MREWFLGRGTKDEMTLIGRALIGRGGVTVVCYGGGKDGGKEDGVEIQKLDLRIRMRMKFKLNQWSFKLTLRRNSLSQMTK